VGHIQSCSSHTSKNSSGSTGEAHGPHGAQTRIHAVHAADYIKTITMKTNSERSCMSSKMRPLRVGTLEIDPDILQEWQSEKEEDMYQLSEDSDSGVSKRKPFCARSCFPRTHSLARTFLRSQVFEIFIGVSIVTNSVLIGLEQSWDLHGRDVSLFQAWEHVFLVIYTFELLLRFFVYGRLCLKDGWVRFDIFVVIVSVISSWVLQPLLGRQDQLAPVLVLRTARLLKLVRTVKLLMKLKELWLLVQGLISSAATMFYTLLLLVVILYVFASLGIEIITKHELAMGPNADPQFSEIVNMHFSDLPRTMLTLIQFVTLDSVNAIYSPLVEKDPAVAVYFVSLMLIVSIVLMNLITAVIVNSALEQATHDREAFKLQEEKRRKRLVVDLKQVFQRLDDDGSGKISVEELLAAPDDDKALVRQCMRLDDLLEVFCLLDSDGGGQIDIEEFCDGILNAITSESPIELKRMEKAMSVLAKQMQVFETVQSEISKSIEEMVVSFARARYQSAAGDLTSVMAKRKEEPAKLSEPLPEGGAPAWAKQMMKDIHELRSEGVRVTIEKGPPNSPSKEVRNSSAIPMDCRDISMRGGKSSHTSKVVDISTPAPVNRGAAAAHPPCAGVAQSVMDTNTLSSTAKRPPVPDANKDLNISSNTNMLPPLPGANKNADETNKFESITRCKMVTANRVPTSVSETGPQAGFLSEPRTPAPPPSTMSSPRMSLEADSIHQPSMHH